MLDKKTIQGSINEIIKRFPIEGYMTPGISYKGAYETIIESVARHLPENGTIIDFGAGPADKIAMLQYLGWKCTGYDELEDEWHKIPGNREVILDFIRSQGVDYHLASEGPLLSNFSRESFDMAMSNDVLEHLHDSPREILNDLLELVVPCGLLLITVPNAGNIRKRLELLFGGTNHPRYKGYYWPPGPWRGHVREYVRSDLRLMSEYLGLEVLELRGCDHMLEKVPAIARPFYLAVTSLFNGWKDSWLLVARKPEGWKPKRSLSDQEIAKILEEASSYKYSK